MYTAKQSGRNRYQFYSEDMTARAIERLSLERDLRGAVERGEMFLVYQPQIELATRRIIGAEVLMRWRHATQGLISPPAFHPGGGGQRNDPRNRRVGAVRKPAGRPGIGATVACSTYASR